MKRRINGEDGARFEDKSLFMLRDLEERRGKEDVSMNRVVRNHSVLVKRRNISQ